VAARAAPTSLGLPGGDGLGRGPVPAEAVRPPELVAGVLGELDDRPRRRPAERLLEQRRDRRPEALALLGRPRLE
jgi:hypothetical protein